MANLRAGTITRWDNLSPVLATFDLKHEAGHPFPSYEAGQYVALRREDCHLTKRVVEPSGKIHYVPDLDEAGQQKTGPVTHSYSVCSDPGETARSGLLEFYVVLEKQEGELGRLTEALFRGKASPLTYVDRIVGDFTLNRRTKGFESVLFVGTGTGLAPFVSMVRHLHAEGGPQGVRYTLLHTNRTREELGYHDQLRSIAASGQPDLLYVPTVSRPAPGHSDVEIGTGRANNVLRAVFGMPSKEKEDGQSEGIRASLPAGLSLEALRDRLDPKTTVLLVCGNSLLMEDVRQVAAAVGMRFEKEDW